MNEACVYFLEVAAVSLVAMALAAVWSKGLKPVSKEAGEATEVLVSLGWDPEDAKRRVKIAIEKRPDADTEKLVNIAISYEDGE